MKIWDISEPIEEATATFPGDTPFSRQWVMRLEDGGSCNVSTIRMSVHVGTHTDAPLHFASDADGIGAVGLEAYLGRCRVATVRGAGSPALVPAAVLTDELLAGVERLLLHTQAAHDHRRFDPEFTALGPEAAARLVEKGVKLVGIDTPSIDPAAAKHLEGHLVLHRGGTAILENIDLSAVPDGDYELIALPLKIRDSDSSPVRAVLRELP